MNAPAADPSDVGPTLAQRLGDSVIEIRNELEFSRQVFRGEVSYVVRDPISFKTFRLSNHDYRILVELRSDRPLRQCLRHLQRLGHIGHKQEDAFYRFVLTLHKKGLVKLPVSDGARLYERYNDRKEAKRKQMMTNPLFLRVPLLRPDALLRAHLGLVKHAFTKPAFLLWLLIVGFALTVGYHERDEFLSGFQGFFGAQNLIFVWFALIGLKVVHEFGHAFACRMYGGAVPEMGVILIALTPVAYVDATSSWGFPSKAKRIIVALAGMYVEVFVAAICLLWWEAVEDGPIRQSLHSMVVLSSIVTIGFNANPLMKFDGYYVVSDLLEVPNMRQVSTDARDRLLKRIFLGVKSPLSGDAARRARGGKSFRTLRGFLATFGFMIAIYRFMIVVGISTVVALKFPLIGLALAGSYAGMEVYRAVATLLHYLFKHEETAGVRAFAGIWALAIFVGVPLAIGIVPIPNRVHALGVVRAENERQIHAPISGEILDVAVTSGQFIQAGDPVVELDAFKRRSAVEEAHQALKRSAAELRSLRAQSSSAIVSAEASHAALQRDLERKRDLLEAAVIRSPLDGIVIEVGSQAEEGRWCTVDEPIARVISGVQIVEAMLTDADIAETNVGAGTRVEFAPIGYPGLVLMGTIVRCEPAGVDQVDDERFAALAGLEIDPVTGSYRDRYFRVVAELDDFKVGSRPIHQMTGKMTIEGEAETLGQDLQRWVTRFLDRLRD